VSDYFKNIYFMFLQYDGNLLKHKSLAAKCHHQRSGNSTTHPTIVSFLFTFSAINSPRSTH